MLNDISSHFKRTLNSYCMFGVKSHTVNFYITGQAYYPPSILQLLQLSLLFRDCLTLWVVIHSLKAFNDDGDMADMFSAI